MRAKEAFAAALRLAVRDNIAGFTASDCTATCVGEIGALQTTCAGVTAEWAKGLVGELTAELAAVSGVCEGGEVSAAPPLGPARPVAATLITAAAALVLR